MRSVGRAVQTTREGRVRGSLEAYNAWLMLYGTESTQSERGVQTDTFEAELQHDDGLQIEDSPQSKVAAVPYSAMQFPLSKGPQGWKKRPRSPGLKWYKRYGTPESLKTGRVLVIDYVKQGTNRPQDTIYKRRLLGCIDMKSSLMTCRRPKQGRYAESRCPRNQLSRGTSETVFQRDTPYLPPT